MSDLQLDPRALKVQNVVKYTGVGLVAVAASGFVVVTGASVVVAGLTAIAGLFTVNFAVPLAARTIAVWKQKSLTAIAETFSEETIREDERQEDIRVSQLQSEYITAAANIQNAQDELRNQLASATDEEKELLNSQIQALQDVVNDAEKTIEQRIEDLAELKRTNKLYIALHRASKAMGSAQSSKRDAEQMQRLETARAAIKTRMRSAMAGQKIAQLNQGNKLQNSSNIL